MKAISRIENLIKQEETLKKQVINPLFSKIAKYIHGMEEIDTQKHISIIKEIISNYTYEGLEISNIQFFTSKYNFEKRAIDNNYNDRSIYITFDINGIINGNVACSITPGTRGYDTPIYYYSSYDEEINNCKIVDLKNKLNILNRHEFINNMVDLCFKEKVYANYEDNYGAYEIWQNEISRYDSSIKGNMRYDKGYKSKKNKTLKQLIECEDIRKFADEKMYGEKESIEWWEYRL